MSTPSSSSSQPDLEYITSLDLSSRDLHHGTMRFLIDVLEKTPQLKKLDLSGNHIMPESIEDVCRALHKVPHLTTLIMTRNACPLNFSYTCIEIPNSPIQQVPIDFEKIFSCLPNLEELDLSLNACSHMAMGTFGPELRLLPHLRILRLGSNFLESSSIDLLAEAFPFTPHLEELYLGPNFIREEGIRTLVQTFPSIPKVRKLDVSNCSLGPSGCLFLLQNVHRLPHLEELNLFEISMTTRTSQYQELFHTIWNHKPIQNIKISGVPHLEL